MLNRVDVGLSLRSVQREVLLLNSPTPVWVWERQLFSLWGAVILFVTITVYNN